ncbi:RES family NAD+ phosphorylase [Streptomyces sp. NPDC048420]|uniref:RES family NAD+ phosphorylase n=1 Tax=Streptomyces sp. NPDC048420 TaxID=3155755 RepID=UPI00343662B5
MESADGDDGAASWKPAAVASALCFAHIDDRCLEAELQGSSFEGACTFCPDAGCPPVRVVLLPRLAETVLLALSGFGCPADTAVEWTDADSHKVPPDPAQAVAEACDPVLDPDVLTAVQEYIDQRRWDGTPIPFAPRSRTVQDSWEGLCRTVAERDLGLPDRVRLESLMGRIAGIVRDENLIKRLDAGVRIWRGRMRSDRTPPGYRAVDIGSVPPERAAENRMSRAGVPLFYGSSAVGTAVVEISARDNRPFAAVAAFETTRPLRLLDLVDIPEPPSLFDRRQAARRDSLVFLQDFARDLSRPVFYDGRKHRDYRPTQYLTDYVRQSTELGVDGIRFRSAHNGGVNYALFVDAAHCLEPEADGQGTLRLIKGSERVEDLGRDDVTQAV